MWNLIKRWWRVAKKRIDQEWEPVPTKRVDKLTQAEAYLWLCNNEPEFSVLWDEKYVDGHDLITYVRTNIEYFGAEPESQAGNLRVIP